MSSAAAATGVFLLRSVKLPLLGDVRQGVNSPLMLQRQAVLMMLSQLVHLVLVNIVAPTPPGPENLVVEQKPKEATKEQHYDDKEDAEHENPNRAEPTSMVPMLRLTIRMDVKVQDQD